MNANSNECKLAAARRRGQPGHDRERGVLLGLRWDALGRSGQFTGQMIDPMVFTDDDQQSSVIPTL